MSQQVSVVRQFEMAVMKKENAIRSVLPLQVPPKKWMRAAVTAYQTNPDLHKCELGSIMSSCMKAATDGLILDGREAALVVFNKKQGDRFVPVAQYMPMVAGILKKARNSGQITMLSAHVVYEKDQFDYELGFEPELKHKPFLDGDPGKVRCAYAIATLRDGSRQFEVMTNDEIMKVAKSSKSGWDSKSGKLKGVWDQWFSEMARKTVLKRLCKYLPSSADLESIVNYDNELERPESSEIDITGESEVITPVQEEKPKKGRTRAAAAITADAAEPEPAPTVEMDDDAVIEGSVFDEDPLI